MQRTLVASIQAMEPGTALDQIIVMVTKVYPQEDKPKSAGGTFTVQSIYAEDESGKVKINALGCKPFEVTCEGQRIRIESNKGKGIIVDTYIPQSGEKRVKLYSNALVSFDNTIGAAPPQQAIQADKQVSIQAYGEPPPQEQPAPQPAEQAAPTVNPVHNGKLKLTEAIAIQAYIYNQLVGLTGEAIPEAIAAMVNTQMIALTSGRIVIDIDTNAL